MWSRVRVLTFALPGPRSDSRFLFKKNLDKLAHVCQENLLLTLRHEDGSKVEEAQGRGDRCSGTPSPFFAQTLNSKAARPGPEETFRPLDYGTCKADPQTEEEEPDPMGLAKV
jgi:hypothetical protein